MIPLVLLLILTLWIGKGYIEYQRRYYDLVMALYMDKKNLPGFDDQDYIVSKLEADRRKWIDLKFYVFQYRWPFKCIRFTKKFWVRKLKDFKHWL